MRKLILSAIGAGLVLAAASSETVAQPPAQLGPGYGSLPNGYSPFGPGFTSLNNATNVNSYPASTWQYGAYQPYMRSYYDPSYGNGMWYNGPASPFGGDWNPYQGSAWNGYDANRFHHHR